LIDIFKYWRLLICKKHSVKGNDHCHMPFSRGFVWLYYKSWE
jgi:hypothetical protein